MLIYLLQTFEKKNNQETIQKCAIDQ
jgi:hypothetical protein